MQRRTRAKQEQRKWELNKRITRTKENRRSRRTRKQQKRKRRRRITVRPLKENKRKRRKKRCSKDGGRKAGIVKAFSKSTYKKVLEGNLSMSSEAATWKGEGRRGVRKGEGELTWVEGG